MFEKNMPAHKVRNELLLGVACKEVYRLASVVHM